MEETTRGNYGFYGFGACRQGLLTGVLIICSINLYCLKVIECCIVLKVKSFGKGPVRCNGKQPGSRKQVVRQPGMLFFLQPFNYQSRYCHTPASAHKFFGKKRRQVGAEEGKCRTGTEVGGKERQAGLSAWQEGFRGKSQCVCSCRN